MEMYDEYKGIQGDWEKKAFVVAGFVLTVLVSSTQV